jgi:ElaB/YqjD/DUF883 family membrane-anchored ribosome-binding protein
MERHNGPHEDQAIGAVPGTDGTYTARAAGAVHEGVDKLKERIEPGEERLRAAAANAEGKLRDAGARASDRYGEVVEQTRVYVREHPLTAAAIAFAAGAVVVSWLRR